ncbi:MAG: hypothetical protein ACYTFY_20360, partial [Planctomycetota bacterium]
MTFISVFYLPALTIQDPVWLNSSDAMGPLHPYDKKRFPRMEGFLSGFFDSVSKTADTYGDYGFLDYGNGPHWIKGGAAYKGHPRFYRYYNFDYGFRTCLWYLYARSGERKYFDYAARYNRHLADFKFSHWQTRAKPLGAKTSMGDGITPLYWMSRVSFWGVQGISMRNYKYFNFLTGDERVLDVVKGYAEYMKKNFDPLILPGGVSNGITTQPFQNLAELYAFNWDPEIGKMLYQSRVRLVDLESSSGLAPMGNYGTWYKPYSRIISNIVDFEVTGSKLSLN